MTVSVEFRVDVRPYSGYDDPSLPVAAWIAQGDTVGDASGGLVFMDFLFQRSDDQQISELYNLEQIQFDNSTNNIDTVMISTLAMDALAPNRPVLTQRWQFATATVGALAFAALPLDRANMLPLWLGSPNKVEGNGGIRLNFANTNLRLYQATMQGYMWGPRSVLAQGGPRRPVGGLFRG